ncbi:hypothetical protein V6N11_071799 [Hibiscus sabdariffa]|uniref:Uncharacterized protein n=1 Tax=Hibiscus sabdariffa TaxID=183260 RepID=A0ABR2U145_9ROSI
MMVSPTVFPKAVTSSADPHFTVDDFSELPVTAVTCHRFLGHNSLSTLTSGVFSEEQLATLQKMFINLGGTSNANVVLSGNEG